MNHSYHNTTESSGQDLDKYESQAKSQDEIILQEITYHDLAFYGTRYQKHGWTPSEVEQAIIRHHNKHWPITSIRRALSNLTKRGLLQKLDTQRNGPHNRPEHCWSLPAGQQRLF